MSAAVFLIRQIVNGSVPDVNRALRIYKLHPNQAFLYGNDRALDAYLKGAFDAQQDIAQFAGR